MKPDTITTEPELIGHDRARRRFLNAVASGKLHHGWIIHGPRGIGKALFCLEMAAHLIGDEALNANAMHLVRTKAHPDLVWLDRHVGLADGKKPPRTIPVAAVRAASTRLQSTASGGGRRVLVVDALDELNVEGANALLKTLEEPPKDTVLLLVAHQIERVLPTIQSRCTKLALRELSSDEMEEWRSRQSDTSGSSEAAVMQFIAGQPGLAALLDETPTHGELLLSFQSAAIAPDPQRNVEARLKVASDMARLSPNDRQFLFTLIDSWLQSVLHQLVKERGTSEGSAKLAEAWSRFQADRALATAINTDLSEVVMALFEGMDQVYMTAQPSA